MFTKQFCFMQYYLKKPAVFSIIYFSFLVAGWIDLAAPPVITIVDFPTPLHFFIPGGNVEIAGNIWQVKQENVSLINLCF